MDPTPAQKSSTVQEPKKIPEFSKLLRRAFEITRHNKFLWILGMLSALGGGGFRGNFGSFGGGGGSSDNVEGPSADEFTSAIEGFIETYWVAILIGVILLLLIGLAVAVISVISRAGLINAIHKIDEGASTDFKSSFRTGINFFWRLFGLNIVIALVVFIALLIIASPIIYLVVIESYASAILLGIIGFLLIVAISIFLSLISTFASIFAVLAESPVFTAISQAYELIKSNWKTVMLSWLINIGIGIIESVAVILVFLPIVALALITGFMLYMTFSWAGVAIAVFIFVIVAILVSAFVRGLWETYLQTFWILVFKEIAGNKLKSAS